MSVVSATAFGALALFLPNIPSVNAQPTEVSPPPGSMMWHYECKAGTQCPTAYAVKGNQVFATANYASFTIRQIPNQIFLLKVDTGD